MGTSYDGICFYGITFENDDCYGWGEEIEEIFRRSGNLEFDGWLSSLLSVGNHYTYPSYQEYIKAKNAACIARFGYLIKDHYCGLIDYPQQVIVIANSLRTDWRSGPLPLDQIQDLELTESYRQAMEKVRHLLPGASKPGWYYGCSVG